MFARSKYGGDCAAIEQYVLHSLLNARAKVMKIWRKEKISVEKLQKKLYLRRTNGRIPLNEGGAAKCFASLKSANRLTSLRVSRNLVVSEP